MEPPRKSKIPLLDGAKRLIVGNSCERGLVEDVEAMKVIKKGMDDAKGAYPNMQEIAATAIFKSFKPEPAADSIPKFSITKAQKQRVALMKKREEMRIGIPRVLNMYSMNPVFSAYFESLGLKPRNLIYSDYTSEEMYKEGAKRGSIDPCFPSKVAIPHVHNLLHTHHKKKPLDIIFFPMIDCLPSDLVGTQGCRACPTVSTTPAAVKAAFTKEGDLFAEVGTQLFDTFVNLSEPQLFERQMYEQFKEVFGLSEAENRRAVEAGYKALDQYQNIMLRGSGRKIIDQLEVENRLGIVLLGRPYHNDPGICHEILAEFQKLGYPILTQDSLPIDDDILDKLFGNEVRAGVISDSMDIADVWKNSYSENTSIKVWAAKYIARHPNLVALELSNFKCGHDAPIYTVVEEIVQNSGTPYFCFKDIDENKPTGSIKIRVETIDYFLRRYREDMVKKAEKQQTLNKQLRKYEAELRCQLAANLETETTFAAAGTLPIELQSEKKRRRSDISA